MTNSNKQCRVRIVHEGSIDGAPHPGRQLADVWDPAIEQESVYGRWTDSNRTERMNEALHQMADENGILHGFESQP